MHSQQISTDGMIKIIEATPKGQATAQAAPYELVIEFVRAESTTDPFAFRFSDQTYLLRQQDGEYESAVFTWDAQVLDDLRSLQSARPDPEARQRLGERLREFIECAGWSAHEERIFDELTQGRPAYISLRSSAAELYALPWELLSLQSTGQHLGELPQCLLRYEWPGTNTAEPDPNPPPTGGRILVAWSAAGGYVPAAEHVAAVREACTSGHHPFSTQDVLAHVSLHSLRKALQAPGPPVSVLHILCHGGPVGDRGDSFGLAWNARDPGEALEMVDAGALRRVLAPYAGTLRLVVLCACHGSDSGTPSSYLGSVAQMLHRVGIPAVVASRTPLTPKGSVSLTRALYQHLLVKLCSLEHAFLAAQYSIAANSNGLDWAALQLYVRAEDGPDHRPFIFPPYRGLSPFTEEDRRFFVGRDTEIEALVRALQSGQRLLTLVGASGSGKSSLVLAGLVPRVREGALGPGTMKVRVFRPGSRPCHALAAALIESEDDGENDNGNAPRSTTALASALIAHRHALAEHMAAMAESAKNTRMLLVVDQFEELFVQVTEPEEVEAFVANIVHAAARKGPLYVVLTLRADFLGVCMEFMRELLGRMRVVLSPGPDQLRAVIVEPAARVGLQVESAVVDALLDALNIHPEKPTIRRVEMEASNLPLLEFALEALWEHRAGDVIGWSAWEAIGGLRGAIARRADQVLAECTGKEQQDLVRDLFSRLVQLGHHTEDTRRSVKRTELDSIAPGRVEPELQRWINARLLTADGDEVWVAHEVVIREWGTLRRWLAEDRETLMLQQDLSQAAQRWDEHERSADELWRGARLRLAMELSATRRLRLLALEVDFLRAAAAAERETAAIIEAQQQRARADRQRSRLLRMTAMAVMAAVSILGLWARNQQRRAEDRELAVQDFIKIVGARDLLMRDEAAWATALLLEVKRPLQMAWWISEARYALQAALAPRILRGHGGAVQHVAFRADGGRVLTYSADGKLQIWNARRPEEPLVLKGELPMSWFHTAVFSPDGQYVAAGSDDAKLWVWRVDRPEDPLILNCYSSAIGAVTFSPDSRQVAAGLDDGTAWIWPSSGLGEPVRLEVHTSAIRSISFSPDGRHLLTSSYEPIVRITPADGQGSSVILNGHKGPVYTAAFSPSGKQVVTASADGTVRVWPANGRGQSSVFRSGADTVRSARFSADGRRILLDLGQGGAEIWDDGENKKPVVVHGPDPAIRVISFSPDGCQVAIGFWDGRVRVMREGRGGGPIELEKHAGPVRAVAFTPDGTYVVTGSDDATARISRADGQHEPFFLSAPKHEIHLASFSPNSELVATASRSGGLLLWPVGKRAAPMVLQQPAPQITQAALSPDGRYAAAGSMDGRVWLWQLDESSPPVLLHSYPGRITAVAFSRDGTYVLAASEASSKIRIWRVGERGAPVVLSAPAGVLAALFSPDGQRVAVASMKGAVQILPVHGEGQPIMLKDIEPFIAIQVAFSPDGQSVLAVALDSKLRIWAADADRDNATSRGIVGEMVTASFSEQDQHRLALYADPADGKIKIQHSNRKGSLSLEVFHGTLSAAAFTSDGLSLATVSRDGIVQVWRINHLQEPIHEQAIKQATSVSFRHDGQELLVGREDGTALILRMDRTREPIALPEPPPPPEPTSVRFSESGEFVRVTRSDGTVWQWQTDRRGEGMLLEAEPTVRDMSEISPTAMTTAIVNGRVVIKRTDGQEAPIVLQGSGAEVTEAQISPDGQYAIVIFADGTAHLATIGKDALAERLRPIAADCLPVDLRELYLGEPRDQAEIQYQGCVKAAAGAP